MGPPRHPENGVGEGIRQEQEQRRGREGISSNTYRNRSRHPDHGERNGNIDVGGIMVSGNPSITPEQPYMLGHPPPHLGGVGLRQKLRRSKAGGCQTLTLPHNEGLG